MNQKTTKLFLRLAISISFLSAVGDRLGMWNQDISIWGDWSSFLEYTQLINPWFPNFIIAPIGIVVTIIEVIFALAMIVGFKTELFARLSGCLLLVFAMSMGFSTGMKGVFDFSVLSAAAAAFALSSIKGKYLELDTKLNHWQ